MIYIFRSAWESLYPKQKLISILYLCVILVRVFLETASVTLLVPVISLLNGKSLSFVFFGVSYVFGYPTKSYITFAFIFVVLFSSAVRIADTYLSVYIASNFGNEACKILVKRDFAKDYLELSSQNSSKNIISKLNYLDSYVEVVKSIIQVLSSTAIFVGIFSLLLILSLQSTLIIVSAITSLYIATTLSFSAKLRTTGEILYLNSEKRLHHLKDCYNAVSELFVYRLQPLFFELIVKADFRMRQSYSTSQFLSIAPKYIIESFSIVVIILVFYTLESKPFGFALLASFIFGLQKLLPTAQQIYVSWVAIKSNLQCFNDVVLNINLYKCTQASLCHDEHRVCLNYSAPVYFSDLTFRYSEDSPLIFSDLELEIDVGDKIAIIGPSGSGKSTFAKIVLGLVAPTSGLCINARNRICFSGCSAILDCSENISYVPQFPHLFDSTVGSNIALSNDPDGWDYPMLAYVYDLCLLSEFLPKFPGGLHQNIGENGSLLSGGQRQRIAIARALYSGTQAILFDECTSSLNSHCAQTITHNILTRFPDKTVLFITHDHSLSARFDKMLSLI
jgi:ABC-type bacteriocin/lantibiotic exporter with double-glycine peptidase domain